MTSVICSISQWRILEKKGRSSQLVVLCCKHTHTHCMGIPGVGKESYYSGGLITEVVSLLR